MIRLATVALVLVATIVTSANAQDSELSEVLKSLNFQHGHITLMGGVATLDLTAHFAYLDPKDAEIFLTKIWRNPPGASNDTEGMLVPTDVELEFADGWGVVLGYENDGHVSDSDASSINYDDLLAQMKKQAVDQNDERTKKGFPSIILLGWAQPPHYDLQAKTIYWAKRLRFGDDKGETLNYYIRVLGRTGVLDLNVVASVEQLPMITKQAAQLIKVVSFNPGSRYSDYDAGSDHTAAYGIAGLVAGGVLLKAGFLKGLIALLAASWKIVAVAAVGALVGIRTFLKKIMGRSQST